MADTTHENEGLKSLGVSVQAVNASTEDEYIAQVNDADAVITGRFALNARVIGALEKCKVISTSGVGVDRIDLDAATARGIVVTNVPDVFIEEVAVQAMMLL